jgi:endonuclease G, mitochondrial
VLNLSNDDRKQLLEALTSGFRSYAALKIFVSDNFIFRLNEIAPSTATKIASDALIDHFEEGGEDGDVCDLILALHQARPHNAEVKKLMCRLQGFVKQRLVLDLSTTETVSLEFELPTAYDGLEFESFLPKRLSYEDDVGRLRRGLQLADAVCKVVFSDRDATGTGVLISSDLVLTNYHVLSKQVIQDRSLLDEKAKTLQFEFGFISEKAETPSAPETFMIATSASIVAYSPPDQLDYVLLRVEPRIKSFDFIKPLPIHSAVCPLSPNDGLNVLQHPEGDVMQASLSASGVVQVDVGQSRVWYVNRTQGGSSGSPCFNLDWKLVALHHASVSRGFGSIREGILFSSILVEIADFLV